MQSYRLLTGIILIFMFLFSDILSQDKYQISGSIYIRDGNTKKISLNIKDKNRTNKIPVDNNGNFMAFIRWDKVSNLYFSKPGYITKIIEFDTTVPSELYRQNISPYEILIELYPTFPYADTVFYKKPIAKILYSREINDFDYDLDYHLLIKEKVDKTKSKYNAWLKRSMHTQTASKYSIEDKQKEAIDRYKKSVETKVITKEIPKVKVKPIINTKAKPEEKENPFGAPPLLTEYAEGKTIEVFNFTHKKVTRVIIKKRAIQKVYYKVQHNWGGLFYFLQESPSFYRSISKTNFDKSTNS